MKIRQSTALVSLVLKKEKRMLTFKTLWDNKNAGEEPILKRIVLKHAPSFKCGDRRCILCLLRRLPFSRLEKYSTQHVVHFCYYGMCLLHLPDTTC